MRQYRQGDVMLVEVKAFSLTEAKPVPRDRGRVVLAYGEVTGHAHVIDDALAELFEERDGRIYLKASGPVDLVHEEHGTIAIAPGTYEVIRQREYNPSEIRRVSD